MCIYIYIYFYYAVIYIYVYIFIYSCIEIYVCIFIDLVMCLVRNMYTIISIVIIAVVCFVNRYSINMMNNILTK